MNSLERKMDKEFQEWMDEQMSKYRDESVPFIGYVWYERGGTFGGGALYRLDTVEVKQDRFSGIGKIYVSTREPK
jgi:hypothetical protein